LKSLMRNSLDQESGVSERNNKMPILSFESILHCLLATFGTLDSHHGLIDVDLVEYYNTMYQALWRLRLPSEHRNIGLTIECLRRMLIRNVVGKERVLAFAKRILTVSTYLPAWGSISVMHLVNQVIIKHSCVKSLVDEELQEGIGVGKYQAELPDPDQACASSACGWEGLLQSRSFHPYLNQYSTECFVEQKLPAVLSRVPAIELLRQYDASEGGFNPAISIGETKTNKEKRRLEILRKIGFQNLRENMDRNKDDIAALLPASNENGTTLEAKRPFSKLFWTERLFQLRTISVKMKTVLKHCKGTVEKQARK